MRILDKICSLNDYPIFQPNLMENNQNFNKALDEQFEIIQFLLAGNDKAIEKAREKFKYFVSLNIEEAINRKESEIRHLTALFDDRVSDDLVGKRLRMYFNSKIN